MSDLEPLVIDGALSEAELRVLGRAVTDHSEYTPSSYTPAWSRRSGPPAVASVPTSGPLADEHVGWRYDVASHFNRSGGSLGRDEPLKVLGPRNNYLRGYFVRAGRIEQPGIESILNAPVLGEAARAVHGRLLVQPEWIYTNVLLPGQELAVHTDVPEFIGARRNHLPGCLLVVMHHSGLFESRRVRVATTVIYLSSTEAGGGFFHHPADDPGRSCLIAPQPNRLVTFDADSVFHGVEPVPGDDRPLLALRAVSRLSYRVEGDHWLLLNGDKQIAIYNTAELRISVSWKALCFSDEQERERFATPDRALSRREIVYDLFRELRRRGRVQGKLAPLSEREVADMLIGEFVPFPPVPVRS